MSFLANILPNIHPAFVHLPLALLPTAVALDLAGFIMGKWRWLERSAATLYTLGALGAVAAFITGNQAVDSVGEMPPRAVTVVSEHADYALIVLILFAVVATVRVGLSVLDRDKNNVSLKPLRAAMLVVAVAGLWFLVETGKRGGELVFEHRVGVAAVRSSTAPQPSRPHVPPEEVVTPPDESPAAALPSPPADSPRDRLRRDDDDVLTWQPIARDKEALGEVLEFAVGVSERTVVAAESVEDSPGLELAVTGESLLVLPGKIGNVQVDVELDLTNFDGVIGIAHHVHGIDRFDSFQISADGKGTLIRRSAAGERVLDGGVVPRPYGRLRATVSASGRHFYGRVDGQAIAHGHAPPEAEGQVGIYLSGEGTVRIYSVVISPL